MIFTMVAVWLVWSVFLMRLAVRFDFKTLLDRALKSSPWYGKPGLWLSTPSVLIGDKIRKRRKSCHD